MKKILIAIISSVIFVMFSAAVGAEEVDGLSEKIDALIMENNFTQEQIEDMDRQYVEDFDEWFWNEYLTPTKILGKMHKDSDEEEYKYCLNRDRPDYSYGILMSKINNKYAQQYVQNHSLGYLLEGNQQYWAVMRDCGNGLSAAFSNMGERIYNYGQITITTEMIDYLKEKKQLGNEILENGEKTVQDLKVFSVANGLTLLYIKCEENEYLMKLYGFTGYCDYIPKIEMYKLYPAQEVLSEIAVPEGQDFPPRQREAKDIAEEKPVYTTEAENLQAGGLLNGNEKGLDLLKPLTRIEATAILVRAMGLEDTQTSGTSYFADIQSDNWGAKYANIAKDKGIADGIGDNLFAPNDTITASQFATLILRNQGENPDWQTAINTFVERGLITSEQAEKMDLFTRGDMAKIIYEAKQRNMF